MRRSQSLGWQRPIVNRLFRRLDLDLATLETLNAWRLGMHLQSLEPWKHGHGFGQHNARPGEQSTRIVVVITICTMVVEIAAGLAFGSIALLADGLHMGSHAAALGLSTVAYVYARRHAHDPRFSFGTGKVNALAGFTGAVLLAGFAFFIAIESIAPVAHSRK